MGYQLKRLPPMVANVFVARIVNIGNNSYELVNKFRQYNWTVAIHRLIDWYI